MKKIYTLTMMMLFACVSQVSAQRYLEEVFDDVTVTNEVQYGTNATVLAYAIFGEAIPENLMMDIYEPEGDTETERPLILFFHTGNFLPHPENGGTGGLRTDSAAVEICSRMARMGYVVASCDYRLGWNPLAETQEERVSTLINAAYRGVQDARTAARFFRADAIDGDNDYGIDESRIVVWGQGTGGYISMASATLDEYEDILLPKFITEDLIPMVIESINGDIFGTSYGINPFDGDTLCYVNHEGYDSDFQACVNLGGAMGDISWL
ncbi:MAG: alpha/beta hydrolase, partial [Flavobacteriales bacterium]|nr:alpha/beta hydrolase [Flavobacteriales bacterium]